MTNLQRILVACVATIGAAQPLPVQGLMTENADPRHTEEVGLQDIVKTVVAPGVRFPYWQNMGMLNQSTGIYLGNGFVLTAAHVGPGLFSLQDGSSYRPVSGSEKRFRNADGSFADLTLFQVSFQRDDLLAKLPAIPLRRTGPGRGSVVVLLGAGSGNASKEPSLAAADYRWNGHSVLRWGLNRVEYQYQEPIETYAFRTMGYSTRFSRDSHDCQATPGDSGGGVFAYNPMFKRWELCGIILAVDGTEGQAAFGNHTYIGDLSILPVRGLVDSAILASW